MRLLVSSIGLALVAAPTSAQTGPDSQNIVSYATPSAFFAAFKNTKTKAACNSSSCVITFSDGDKLSVRFVNCGSTTDRCFRARVWDGLALPDGMTTAAQLRALEHYNEKHRYGSAYLKDGKIYVKTHITMYAGIKVFNLKYQLEKFNDDLRMFQRELPKL